MNMIILQILYSIILPLAMGQTEPNSKFQEAITAFESSQWDKAQTTFQELLQNSPGNPTLLFNLGRVEYEKGQLGLALGLWRKARSLDPNYEPVKMAIRYAEEKHFPERSSPPVYMVIFNFLTNISLHIWIGVSFLFFLIWAIGSVEYGVKRKMPVTQWPGFVHVGLPIFMVALTFSILVAVETFKQKATIIANGLETHISPSDTSPTLAELYEGQVVVVEKFLGEWAQIRSMSGTPGWVPRKSIIIFRGNE